MVEVADSSLDYDRRKKLPLYAAAGIQVYRIINLIDRIVEVYTVPDPVAGQSGSRVDYRPGQAVPVEIAGRLVGTISVAEPLP